MKDEIVLLEKGDWLTARRTALSQIREARMMLLVGQTMLNIANGEIKALGGFPVEGKE